MDRRHDAGEGVAKHRRSPASSSDSDDSAPKHKKHKKEKKEKKEKKGKKEKKEKKSSKDKKEDKKRIKEAKKFLARAGVQLPETLAGALQQVAADPNASINARLAALAAGGDASQSAVGGPSWSGWGVNGAAAPKGPWDGAAAAAAQQMEDRMNTMRNQRMEQSNWKTKQKEELDDMLPKATGREAQMEKKAVRRQEAKDRDDDGVMTTMYGGGDVMGGDDSFAAAKRRVEAAGQRRNQKTNVRREQLEVKARDARQIEDDRMAPFRALVAGGAAGGKMSIPKRVQGPSLG